MVDTADTRKSYVLTDEGRKSLAEQSTQLERTLARLRELQSRAKSQRPAELVRAMMNLRTALGLRFGEGNADQEALEKAAAIIDRAAVEIQRI